MRTFNIALCLIASGMFSANSVQAQDMTAGQIEFQQVCASCHGTNATGDGPVAAYINVAMPDLTKISERNGGVFPFQAIMEMIDGRQTQRQFGPHGSNVMPVWGNRYAFGEGSDDPIEAEINTLGRMASLAYYLDSLQSE